MQLAKYLQSHGIVQIFVSVVVELLYRSLSSSSHTHHNVDRATISNIVDVPSWYRILQKFADARCLRVAALERKLNCCLLVGLHTV